MSLPRRSVLGLALALAAFAGAARAVPAHEPDDMALGSPKAPITVIEYASVGCPHCAAWHNETFPTIRVQYVNTGRMRLVMREMLTGEPNVAAAGFMLARCAGPAKYFPMIDAMFRRQASMFQPPATPEAVLRDIARSVGGMSDQAFDACLADPKALAAVNDRSQRHANVDKVDATPTFFVGGQRLVGELTADQVGAALSAAGHGR